MNDSIKRQRLDTFMILIVVLLVIISCITLFSLQNTLPAAIRGRPFYIYQGVWFIAGVIAVGAIMLVDFDQYRRFAMPLYWIGVLSLVGLFFLPWAVRLNGALSWYQIPIVNTTVQPAEFMKLFLILALAHVIASHNEKWEGDKNLKYDFILLGKMFALTLPPFYLILIQPDTGIAVVILFIVGFMALISGLRWRFIFSLVGITFLITALATIIYLTFPDEVSAMFADTEFEHALERIQAWQDPTQYQDGSAAQAIRSALAVGSGQLFGKGIMGTEVYVYERHTDMIFSAIAEQFGFIGSSIVIVLFFLLIYRIIQIALECRDPFGTYLSIGIVGMLTYQIFQNIGMSIQLIPLTGLPLPFISYGGTSLIVYLAAIGFILNIHSRQKSFMFETENR
ncbi:FtsW/RodA/SpoVE family cell cycle protein [Aquisalibacillus elongatus]|uniref:Cell division protein FtsW (Lipid II flippase) n=1 Tax=Aquisalibacillus elongatus TaxID=485577 RepID=A0A3N5B9G9_9BACI|nr:FtsW/RodA/SpoVE family cell cycle protein [Aquisalibacillus elongatus]RPF52120.1 cell division protein FtsW (lipid II flippase) [Aquisalibacillus elongatus]